MVALVLQWRLHRHHRVWCVARADAVRIKRDPQRPCVCQRVLALAPHLHVGCRFAQCIVSTTSSGGRRCMASCRRRTILATWRAWLTPSCLGWALWVSSRRCISCTTSIRPSSAIEEARPQAAGAAQPLPVFPTRQHCVGSDAVLALRVTCAHTQGAAHQPATHLAPTDRHWACGRGHLDGHNEARPRFSDRASVLCWEI